MDESRREAYLNLINQLLNCPSGEAEEILNDNSELVDAGLLQMMEQEADDLAQQGDENNAARLRNLASQLGEYVDVNFLMQVLKTTRDNGDESQQVYQLLGDNLDKLNDNFADVLRDWATAKLSEMESEKAQAIAGVILNFSNLIRQFSQGSIASNVEIAIAGCKVAATVFTHEASPQNWAATQHHLGLAYRKRRRGNKAEDLDKAIGYYLAALEVYTREAFAKKWAETQNNLAVVYRKRIKGGRAENLEAAIHYCNAALEVYTRKAFPQNWARTQHNLAALYYDRIKGDRAENLEAAIHYCNTALEVRTSEACPHEWATTLNTLAVAYIHRIKEDRAENLETAIGYSQAVLEACASEASNQFWAKTLNNLAVAFYERSKGDKAKNLESAIQAYEAALKVRLSEPFPQYWAIAMTQNNVGNAYCNRIEGDKTENLDVAIQYYEAAIQVHTREALPQDWALAMTQNNLGNAYRERGIKGGNAEDLEAAIGYCQAALAVYTRQAFPQDFAETLFNLGLTYKENNKKSLAHDAFADAIETVEYLRDEIVSGDESKRKLAEEYNKIYQQMVEVCLEMGKPTEAIEYAEQSKTRNLVEQILTRDLKSIVTQEEDLKKLEQLRDEIASGQYDIQNAKAENSIALAQHLQQLRKQRNELQDKYLQVGSGFQLEPFQQTLNDQIAIVYLYITNTGLERFIITCDSLKHLNVSNLPEKQDLDDWANEYLDAYTHNKIEWRNSLASRLSNLSEILHIDEILADPEIKKCNRLILIPHRYLHLLPLHALPLSDGEFLCDRFPNGVSYAPSCQLLQLAKTRKRPDFTHLFAIQNPTEDLFYTNLEVEVIRSYFYSVDVLAKQAATKTALSLSSNFSSAHCSHFSCHGKFNLESPLESALLLANEEPLSLGEIFGLNLNQCRLVTLSACETGLTDPTSISDEYIGLPSGFLYAGSPSVVSSLWRANDLSTSLLMIKFYEILIKPENREEGYVAIALNQAQKWLRNLTLQDFDLFLEQYKPQIETILEQLRPGQRSLFKESLEQIRQRQPLPFTNPYYWAAFTATGV